MNYAMYITYLLVYGIAASTVIGLVAAWVDRKVTARVQYRVGPPFMQPAYDIIKLLGKETLIPHGASRLVFLGAPAAGLAGVIVVSTLLWANNIGPDHTFVGDVIVMIYLLLLPSLSLIMGGFASRNPLASLGASREMKLIVAYELPFVMAMMVPVIKSGFSLQLGEIVRYQWTNGPFVFTLSGFLAWFVALWCIQAKLGLVPFDLPEAETELAGGLLIEYSGVGLALFRLMKTIALFVLPFVLITLFMGGVEFRGLHWLGIIPKYVVLLVLITVIRNTNPRVRIDQAMRFYWGPMAVLGLAAVALALAGW